MSAISPKIGQAAIAAVYKLIPTAKVIGIKINGSWQGGDRLSVNGTEFRVAQCSSVLEIRELLLEGEEDLPLVILTDLEEFDLGNDLLARFAKRRLMSIKPWSIIADLFQAKAVAPSLQNKRWLAEALLERLAPQNFPTVTSGMLDDDTVWRIVLSLYINLEQPRPDAKDLLEWTLQENGIDLFNALNPELKEGIRGWLRQSAGTIGEQVLNTIETGYGKDVLPIGLALQVIFSQTNNLALRDAAIRLERFTNNKISLTLAKQWVDNSTHLLKKLYRNNKENLVIRLTQRSDAILKEIGALDFAYLSDYSPKGFEMRFESYGNNLQNLLKKPFANLPKELTENVTTVESHWQASWPNEQERVIRAVMSLRLVKWLAGLEDKNDFSTFSEISENYLSDISFVDWARQTLYPGDKQDLVSKAYNQLLKIVLEKRETFNNKFAKFLANWTESGSPSNELIKVEEILKKVVAPVAQSSQSANVLLIVVDGMSYAVFYELLEEILDNGWSLLAPEKTSWPKAVISVLPSITQTSRTSLLCGQLLSGTNADEIKGFRTNADLIKVSKSNSLPILFNQGTLTGTGRELSEDVCTEIANQKRRVVGVIFNAIDDHLSNGEQIAVKWDFQTLPALAQLLESARDANRVVIITSDHGHILEREMTYRKGLQGERYRIDDSPLMADEIRITGSRVLMGNGGTLILPWSETVRYATKKYGYHGGVTPQEMVIPLAVMGWNNKTIPGWKEFTVSKPSWWDVTEVNKDNKTGTEVQTKQTRQRSKTKDFYSLLDLIDDVETSEQK